MSVYFEELDFRPTPMGALSLRRRRQLSTGIDVYEIKLGDEFLMSSLFTVAEIALARLGLAALQRTDLDVAVGGLGLGYTAQAVLEDPRVRSLIVVDALAEVIEWHERGLLPLGEQLTADPRCRLVHGDFFAMSASTLDPQAPGRRFDAVLVDIDHSPRTCCIRTTPRCTGRRVYENFPGICIPAACLRCGRTIRRIRHSRRCWRGRLQRRMRMS